MAIGGLAGAIVRWAITELVPSSTLPWAALIVNVAGSFLLGLLAAGLTRPPTTRRPRDAGAGAAPPGGLADMALFAGGTGFCGSLTTFSTVTVAIAEQLDAGDVLAGSGYVALSIAAGLGAAALGVVSARHRFRPGSGPA